jgi:hypothetical protein
MQNLPLVVERHGSFIELLSARGCRHFGSKLLECTLLSFTRPRHHSLDERIPLTATNLLLGNCGSVHQCLEESIDH